MAREFFDISAKTQKDCEEECAKVKGFYCDRSPDGPGWACFSSPRRFSSGPPQTGENNKRVEDGPRHGYGGPKDPGADAGTDSGKKQAPTSDKTK